MSAQRKRGMLTILAAALAIESLLAALFGLGSAFQAYLPVRQAGDQFKNITALGTILPGASISYSNLFTYGNVLTLGLREVAEHSAEPARLKISVCGVPSAELTVDTGGPQSVPFQGSCEPRIAAIDTPNPITGPSGAGPMAAARIVSANVSSFLGVPIVALAPLFQCSGAIFLLSLLVFALVWLSEVKGALPVPTIVPVCAFLILRRDVGIELKTEAPLWIFLVALCAGALGAFFAADARKVSAPVNARSLPRGFELATILCIVTFGAIIRFHGIDFGLPAIFHPDEERKVLVLRQMLAAHDLNPHYFRHPTLLLYLSYFTGMFLRFCAPNSVLTTDLFLGGRTVSAVSGTLTVYVLYRLGRKLYSPSVGLGAAALLAVLPLHVTCSRYLKEDALLTFFVTAAAVAAVKAAQDNKKFFLFLSGALAGCAASTKYPGVLAACVVCAAPWLRSKRFIPDKEFLKWTLAALACVPLFFLLCSPYIALTPEKFLADFAYEQHHMEQGHSETITAWSQLWMYHFARSLIPGMTPLTAILSIAAIGFLLWRRKIDDLYVVALVLLYYLPAEWVKAKPAPQPERYILPCLPFLSLALSEVSATLAATRARSLVVALFAMCVVSPAVRSINLASEIMHDTRYTLAWWMNANLQHGSSVCIDFPAYEPPLSKRYFNSVFLPRTTIFEYLNPDSLQKQGCDYFTFSSLFYDRYFSQPDTIVRFRALLRELYNRLPIVTEVEPRYGTYGFHNPRLTLFSLKPQDLARLAQEFELKREGKIDHTSNDNFAKFHQVK